MVFYVSHVESAVRLVDCFAIVITMNAKKDEAFLEKQLNKVNKHFF